MQTAIFDKKKKKKTNLEEMRSLAEMVSEKTVF